MLRISRVADERVVQERVAAHCRDTRAQIQLGDETAHLHGTALRSKARGQDDQLFVLRSQAYVIFERYRVLKSARP